MFPGVYTIEFSGTIGTLGDTLLSGPEGKEDQGVQLARGQRGPREDALNPPRGDK